MANRTRAKKPISLYPLTSPEERLAALKAIRGMWKGRKPDPIKELQKMRRSWDRKLPW